MRFGKALKSRFELIKETPIRILAIAIAVVVSLCYGLVTVVAFSKIPDSVKDFPVAIVNGDKGVGVDGKRVNYGDMIIEEVEKNDSVKWEICDEEQLEEGIEKTDYYLAFVIPDDFSEKVLSARTGKPETAEIQYLSNMRKNFIASQLTRSIRSEFEKLVAQKISQEYATGAFAAIGDAGDGLEKAADGSRKIKDGLLVLKEGAAALDDGASDLEHGAAELRSGAGELASGLSVLNKATAQLELSEISFDQDQKQQVYDAAANSQMVSAAADQISQGVASAVSSNVKAKMTSQGVKSALTSQILSGLEGGYGELLSNLTQEQKTQLVGTIVSASLEGAASGVSEEDILEGISEPVASGLKATAGQSAVSGAQGAIQQVNTAISASSEDMSRLKSSVSQLSNGANSLSEGARQLHEGTGQLTGGTSSLRSGIPQLAEGSGTLTAALEKGGTKIKTELVNSDSEMGKFISDPLDVPEHIYGELTRYSEGFLPLFMSLGIWIGSLVLLFIIPIRRKSDVQLNSPEIVFSGYVTMALFSILEAVLIVTGILVIGIEPASVPQMYFFAVVMALSFSAVLQCFNLAFGIGGNIVGVLVTIFMIPACGGSFPADLMPEFFSKISAFLPMTYSIDGIREALSVGNLPTLLGDCAYLCIFMVVFICLSLIICKPCTRRVEHITEQISRR